MLKKQSSHTRTNVKMSAFDLHRIFFGFVWVAFNTISTLVGYLIPDPVYKCTYFSPILPLTSSKDFSVNSTLTGSSSSSLYECILLIIVFCYFNVRCPGDGSNWDQKVLRKIRCLFLINSIQMTNDSYEN